MKPHQNLGYILAFFSPAVSSCSGSAKEINLLQSSIVDTNQAPDISTIGACHFKIEKMFNGHLRVYPNSQPPRAAYYIPLDVSRRFSVLQDGFTMGCVENTPEQLSKSLGAKYDSGQWLSFWPAREPAFVPFEKKARAQTIPIKGTNWTAMAFTVDDTTGEERTRARIFKFCLIHGTHALCGWTPVMWLAKPKVNDLWKVKAILQSIRFVDPATPRYRGQCNGDGVRQ